MDWFRMYGEFATDPKVQMLSEAMQRRLVMLFCLECSNGLETFHVTERETSIAFALRVSDEDIAATKSVFLARGFINEDWTLRNWSKRQYVSDSSTARVRAHREKKKKESQGDETGVKRSSNAPEQIQNRTDIPPPPREDNFPPPPLDLDTRDRFPMSTTWEPNPKTFPAVLMQLGIPGTPIDRDQFLEFRSYWHATPDEHRTQAKWEHALASHLKRNITQQAGKAHVHNGSGQTQGAGQGQRAGNGGRKLSAPEQVQQAIAEQRAAREQALGAAEDRTVGTALDDHGGDLRPPLDVEFRRVAES